MHLTREEESLLSGEGSAGDQKAMEVLVSIGDIMDAERLIPVKSVQISGVSYKTIGEAGLEFLKDFASINGRMRVYATLNPSGVDLELENKGVHRIFLEKQAQILQAYEKIGAIPSCTCTPYLAGNLPAYKESCAWAESSAVAYANSAIGARTNRESSITALASAVVGKTPLYGLHLDENRLPSFKINVTAELSETFDYSSLGFYVGKHFEGIPYFQGIKPGPDDLKALSAGLATGNITMFHIQEITPEPSDKANIEDRLEFSKGEKREVFQEMNTSEDPDIICIGCPHCSLSEVVEVLKSNPRREVWVYTARKNRDTLKDKIKNKNVRIVSDTCMVVQPLKEMGITSLGTNSTKCAYYSMNLSKIGVKFDSLKNLLG